MSSVLERIVPTPQRVANWVEHRLDRAQLRRASQLPSQIHLSVTDRCFLPCEHCDIWKNDTVDLPTEQWLSLIDRLGQWCAPGGMNFVGGEPLLRKDLERLIATAVGYGFETSFNTNGWLVTEKRAQSLVDAGVSTVYVSLDGLDRKEVDRSRGRAGSFDKAMDAIAAFSAAGAPNVITAAILHTGNPQFILDQLDWVEANGHQLVMQPLYQNFGQTEYNPDWWKTSVMWPHKAEQVKQLHAVLDELTRARLRGRPICNSPAQLQAMKGHFTDPTKDQGVSCRAGHSDLSFDPHGNIRLCYFLDPIGHMDEPVPLSWIWERGRTLRRRWEVSRCDRNCSLLNCNFELRNDG